MTKVDYNIEFFHIYGGDFKNDHFSKEQKLSIQETEYLVKHLENKGSSYSLSVLIDDYNEELKFDLISVVNRLQERGIGGDYFMRESQLVVLADKLLDELRKTGRVRLDKSKRNAVFEIMSDNILLWDEYRKHQERPLAQEMLHKLTGKVVSSERVMRVAKGERFSAKIFLKFQTETGPKYACPLLAASWYLMRLGVEPFDREDLLELLPGTRQVAFPGETLITILPSYYLTVESLVREIIRSSPWKKYCRRLGYIFFPR